MRPVANRVSLAFQSDSDASDGAPLNPADVQAGQEYRAGGRGEKRAFGEQHQKAAQRKRKQLERQGLIHGKDFVVSPENGKTYSAN